jgi:DNA-binding PucR family transcriptional regulator
MVDQRKSLISGETGVYHTLRVFLSCGASYKVAADELNLHFNSVKYRVGRAVARRGREIGSDRLDVELALLACHWYGSAVLQPK